MTDRLDIFSLTPSVVSRDLKNKFLLLYGKSKIGKTSFAAELKRNLFCFTEVGGNALPGLFAVHCQSWTDFKKIVTQLSKPQAKELYDTITVDTVTILWELCVKYICAQNNVDTLGDIEWGGKSSLPLNYLSSNHWGHDGG